METLELFANIGKAVLIQSLGLQKNYTEVASDTINVIDYDTPACRECKCCAIIKSFEPDSQAYISASEICENCPKKTLTQQTVYKKIYHNEKNRYGYKPRLKSNAITLLLLLHFYHPDKFGIICDANTEKLAAELNCDIKTVYNNFDVLDNYGYITYSRTGTRTVNICLNDYEKYYLPANKGGRGFIVMSKELLLKILQLENLMTLRIHLRELLEIDNLNAKGPFTAISKTYKEIKRSLPDYCKPCLIRSAVENSKDIFNISFKDNIVRFEIHERFNCRRQKEECFNQYITAFNEFISNFNETVIAVNSTNILPETCSDFFSDKDLQPDIIFKFIKIRDYEYEDMAQLAMQYSFNSVIDALCQIYRSYILKERDISNLGGLLRTIVTSNQNQLTQTSVNSTNSSAA